jgi:hypothetical protein
MILLYWNIRGLGNQDTQLALLNLIATHKLDFLFLAEPMINFSDVPFWLLQRSHLTKFTLNARDNQPNL